MALNTLIWCKCFCEWSHKSVCMFPRFRGISNNSILIQTSPQNRSKLLTLYLFSWKYLRSLHTLVDKYKGVWKYFISMSHVIIIISLWNGVLTTSHTTLNQNGIIFSTRGGNFIHATSRTQYTYYIHNGFWCHSMSIS